MRIIDVWPCWFQTVTFLSRICVQQHLFTSVQVRTMASYDVTVCLFGRETWTEQTAHSADRVNIFLSKRCFCRCNTPEIVSRCPSYTHPIDLLSIRQILNKNKLAFLGSLTRVFSLKGILLHRFLIVRINLSH